MSIKTRPKGKGAARHFTQSNDTERIEGEWCPFEEVSQTASGSRVIPTERENPQVNPLHHRQRSDGNSITMKTTRRREIPRSGITLTAEMIRQVSMDSEHDPQRRIQRLPLRRRRRKRTEQAVRLVQEEAEC